ncbi:MAG: tetratricopeptide repeat protein, partial [Bdellovibrionaceae bacterium]|nr:tetratricopeptide repeat protein [Pseudobdellovibrionaceae bacterium]
RDGKGGGRLVFNRSKMALPSSIQLKTPDVKPRDIRAVKPPSSNDFYEGNTKEIEYEKLLDQEIKKLYQLSQQYKRSRSRGEIWLRLAEAYVEKAQMVEFREQAEYDAKLRDFLDKKTRIKPTIDLKAARDYNRRAIQLYEWFLRDFPKDKKIDQALFFLGYNHFEAGDVKKGEAYYQRLVKEYPGSAYVVESHFALGEFYFENDGWQKALDNYAKVIQRKKARLNTFAMYKASWCLYRLNRVDTALKMLERVVKMSRGGEAGENVAGRKAVNKVRLAAEALKDYVPFYAEISDYRRAPEEFMRVAQDESLTIKMMERLAYIYADSGNRVAANFVFKHLIGQNPTGERAADYQYQVILTYATADQRQFREELVTWLDMFGPASQWATVNAKNQKLVEDVAKLQETTLRNHVLQMHQTAQNSRAEFSQAQANAGYALYMKHFLESPNAPEMQFFHGELLFDMNKYEEAARVYLWSAEKDPKGKYHEKAVTNAVLALEKDLPAAQAIDAKRGNSIEKMPLDPEVVRFEKAALKYFEIAPKGENVSDIRRRLGVLYYSYNHFDRAIDIFEDILKTEPNSQNAEIAGNLLLDIYKLKGDMMGLTDRANQLLANPQIAKTKFGAEVRGMLEKANFVRAQKLAEGNDYAGSAKEFEKYANEYKRADLNTAARYNAGVNYEKAGEIGSAIRMHAMVLAVPGNDAKTAQMKNDSRNAMARLYQQTGQLEMAAKQYESYANANPKDQKAINAYFNAAVIWDGLGEYNAAVRNYDAYLVKSRRADRLESIFFQAEIARKKGALSRAAFLYKQYLESGARDKTNAIKALFQHAQVSAKLGRPTKSKESYQKTIATYQAYKKQGLEIGAQYAAEARFILAQETLQELRGIRFTQSDRQQANAAAQVKQVRGRYIGHMKEVIRFDYAPMIVAALASSGQMFDYIAYTFTRIPVPAGFSAEDGAKYKELINQEINGIRTEAKNSYKAAWDKAIELESYNEWSKIAARGLSQYDAEFQDAGEISATSNAVDWMGL